MAMSVAHNLYITAMEPGSGKSIVALGLMETLAGKARRAGSFARLSPPATARPQIELIRHRYGWRAPTRRCTRCPPTRRKR